MLEINSKLGDTIIDNKIKSNEPPKNWRLIRESDGLTKESTNILWLEFNEDKTFKQSHNEIAVGRSLIMSPFDKDFTWHTSIITEVIEKISNRYYKFNTKNGIYYLIRL